MNEKAISEETKIKRIFYSLFGLALVIMCLGGWFFDFFREKGLIFPMAFIGVISHLSLIIWMLVDCGGREFKSKNTKKNWFGIIMFLGIVGVLIYFLKVKSREFDYDITVGSSKKQRITKKSVIIVTVLIIIFGYITIWANPYNFKNYMFQYFDYNSIKVGMTKEQVQSKLNVAPLLGSTEDYTYSQKFDEVLLYPIKLKIKPQDYILIFFINGKVVGKKPSSNGGINFNPNEFKKMEKASHHLGVRVLLLMFAGSSATIGGFILFSRYNAVQEGKKKKWLRVLLSFCILISLSALFVLGVNALINVISS